MKNRLTKIIFAVVLIILLLVIAFPFIYVDANRQHVSRELNNAIIDGKYSGWHDVQLDEEHSIKIPDGWSLQTGQFLSLYDDTGNQIAFGKRFEGFPDGNKELRFLSDYYGDTALSYQAGQTQFISGTTNAWCDVEYAFESGKKIKFLEVTYQFGSPPDSLYQYVLYFEEPTDDLHEIATAMIYSAGGGWTYY